jgi:hypothetical protein
MNLFFVLVGIFLITTSKLLPVSHNYPVLQNVKGFFGMVGPNIDVDKTTPMFELFRGDGIVQGIFFENGTIFPVKHIIQTDKVICKDKYLCKDPSEFMKKITNLITDLTSHRVRFPNMLGSANTALMNIKNKTYALFEQDIPYELNIDIENKKIKTIGKIKLSSMHKRIGPFRFSGHTKYDHINHIVHTIDYNIFTRMVTYYKMDMDFTILYMFSKKMDYIPIIHDFKVLESDNIMLFDSPFGICPFMKIDVLTPRTILNHIPLVLRKDLPTSIHILGRNPKKYSIGAGFYCFHFGEVKETNDTIKIYAPLYDEFDFNSLNINGKYREIIIKKDIGLCYMKTNTILETMNLDFPICYGNLTILRRIINDRIGGFVICKGLEIERVIDLPDSVSLFGEHVIHIFSFDPPTSGYEISQNATLLSALKINKGVKNVDGEAHLMAFDKNGSLVLVNLEKDNDVTVIPIFDNGVTLGFHSIFIDL